MWISNLPKINDDHPLSDLSIKENVSQSSAALNSTADEFKGLSWLNSKLRVANTLPKINWVYALIADLVVPEDIENSETKATTEVNLAVVKFKQSVKK